MENDLPSEYKKKSTHKLEKILRKTITNTANKNIGTKTSSMTDKQRMTLRCIKERDRRKEQT